MAREQPKPTIKIAVDIAQKKRHCLKLSQANLIAYFIHNLNPSALEKAKAVAKGLPASPGVACGKIYFNAEEAKRGCNKKKLISYSCKG